MLSLSSCQGICPLTYLLHSPFPETSFNLVPKLPLVHTNLGSAQCSIEEKYIYAKIIGLQRRLTVMNNCTLKTSIIHTYTCALTHIHIQRNTSCWIKRQSQERWGRNPLKQEQFKVKNPDFHWKYNLRSNSWLSSKSWFSAGGNNTDPLHFLCHKWFDFPGYQRSPSYRDPS